MDWTTSYPSDSDQNLYAIYRNVDTLEVFNGSVMTTWVDANIAAYDVPATWGGGDLYGHTIPDLPAGNDYIAMVYVRAGATPAITDTKLPDEFEFRWNGRIDTTPPIGDADWYYSNQQNVEDDISASGLAIMSNMESNDTDAVTARIQRAGVRADALINGRLRSMGYDISAGGISLSDATDASIMLEISNNLVIALLCKWRILQVVNFVGNPQAVIDKIGKSKFDDAMNTLASIDNGYIKLSVLRSVAGIDDNALALNAQGVLTHSMYPPGYSAWGLYSW